MFDGILEINDRSDGGFKDVRMQFFTAEQLRLLAKVAINLERSDFLEYGMYPANLSISHKFCSECFSKRDFDRA